MAKIKTMVGVTVAIFDEEGKLLYREREEHDSITDKDYYGCWELPVVAVQETEEKSIPYNYLNKQLVEGVKREVGIDISKYLDPMPAFYPVMFKNTKGEYDLAMITLLGAIEEKPTKGKTIFVSPRDANNFAKEYEPLKKDKTGRILSPGKGLLSGFGYRQHCMTMKAFKIGSPNPGYRWEGGVTLVEIQRGW